MHMTSVIKKFNAKNRFNHRTINIRVLVKKQGGARGVCTTFSKQVKHREASFGTNGGKGSFNVKAKAREALQQAFVEEEIDGSFERGSPEKYNINEA